MNDGMSKRTRMNEGRDTLSIGEAFGLCMDEDTSKGLIVSSDGVLGRKRNATSSACDGSRWED